jgi:hypothetical protein
MNPRRPPRPVVNRIAADEARRSGITLDQILGNGSRQSDEVIAARRRAILRIVAETGCSAHGVALTWGMGREAASKCFRTGADAYDADTITRLAWAHGAHRAEQIVGGNDPNTQADIASWRTLGTRDAA